LDTPSLDILSWISQATFYDSAAFRAPPEKQGNKRQTELVTTMKTFFMSIPIFLPLTK
jgi:hypothetical protein